MLKRCSNCKYCGLDLKALMMGIIVHKCCESPFFVDRHNILHPFWSGWWCKKWEKENGN